MHTPKPVELTIVAAMDNKRGIGRFGKLPWHVPEDMDHFKKLTQGSVVVMGRATWESLPEKFRPLPGRTNIVLSRYNTATVGRLCPPDKSVIVCEDDFSLLVGLGYLGVRHAHVIGGAAVYANLLHRCDKLELTHLAGNFDCDTHFPEIPPVFKLTSACEFKSTKFERGVFAAYTRVRDPKEIEERQWAHEQMLKCYHSSPGFLSPMRSTDVSVKCLRDMLDPAQHHENDLLGFLLRTEGLRCP